MKSAASESMVKVYEHPLTYSLVMMVNRHGIIHEVHGGLGRQVPAFGQALRLQESGNCFDFFAMECGPLFEGVGKWSLALKEVLNDQSAGTRIESCVTDPNAACWIEITIMPVLVAGRTGALITCIDVTHRRLAKLELVNRDVQERLRQSEDTMAAAQKISHFGSWELDLTCLDGVGRNVLRWSDEVFRIFGHEVGSIETSSENFFRAVHPDDREMISEAVNEAIRTHGRYSIDHRIILPKGEVRYVHEDAQILLDEQTGRPSRMVGTAHDITERKEAADRLWKSNLRHERQHIALARMIRGGVMQEVRLENALRLIAEEIAHAMEVERVSIWRFDPERISLVCQMLYESGTRCHSAGAELQRRDYQAYFSAMEQNETIAADDAQRDPRTCEFTDGCLVPLGITSTLDAPLHVGGVLAGVLRHEHVGPQRTWLPEEKSFATSLAHFISLVFAQWERRQVEDMLRQQASLLDKAKDAIFVRDLDHNITYWNKSAEGLYGWTAKEAKGRKASELLHLDEAQFEESNRRVLADGEWAGEIRQVTKTGAELTVEGRWTLVRDGRGSPKCVLAMNTNITEQKRLEDQILRSQRMESIGTLAGGIAHDLNNVLTPIMMSVDLLNLRVKDPACRETLKTIASSARRGADMLNQVLSFARGIEGPKTPLQLRRLLQELARIVGDTFPKNIHLRLQDELLETDTVSGDPTQIHQVLLNLCVNARDAMPAGGTLTIRAASILIDAQYASMNIDAREGPHIMVSVEDDGAGIAPEILPKIFDPFFTTKETGMGTGLGLSTSLAIMKSHGGFFRVYSELGHGSCFRAYLPAQSAQVTAQPQVEGQAPPRGNHELVLLVDDEAAVREITRQTLEAYGYRVLLAADGAEAMALYSKHQNEIALVFTDMRMPVMDGTTTIQVLMKMNPEVRIIAASGINSNQGIAKDAGAGVRQFLPKPYTAETILRILHQVLKEQ